MASNLLTRMMLAARAGLSFLGKRDMYGVFGYPQNLTSLQLLSKYQRQDIASRVVDTAPEEMWAYPPTMSEMRSVKSKWDDFVSRTHLWDRVIQADKLCAFGPFSLLWLGLPGNPEVPAPQVSRVEDFLYLQAYGGDDAVKVLSYEDKIQNPRYGQPVMYGVKVGPEEDKSSSVQVHYTRVVHIVDKPLRGLMFGEPRLAQVYNVLDDILKIAGGSAETFWLTGNRGMQVDVDKEMDLKAGDAQALSDELDEFQHQLRRYIRTRGVKITTLGSEVADPGGVFNVLISILAGTTNIPQRILMGAEAGQLASEQDRANWAEHIKRRRKVFAEPYVLLPIIQRLEGLGYLPDQTSIRLNFGTPENVFTWPEAFHMSPLEDARTLAEKARATVNYSRRAQFGNPLVSDEEVRGILGLPKDVPEGHTLPEAPVATTSTANPGSGAGRQPGASATESPTAISSGSRVRDVGVLLRPTPVRVAHSGPQALAAPGGDQHIVEHLQKVEGRLDDLARKEINITVAPDIHIHPNLTPMERINERDASGEVTRVIERPLKEDTGRRLQ